MQDAGVSAIRPALDTLRELDNGNLMDKLAVAFHDAVSDVQILGKASEVRLTIKFDQLQKQKLTEPVITVEGDITAKRPKPDGNKALFYIDQDGNPTTKQQRQQGLQFSVAGESKENAA